MQIILSQKFRKDFCKAAEILLKQAMEVLLRFILVIDARKKDHLITVSSIPLRKGRFW